MQLFSYEFISKY